MEDQDFDSHRDKGKREMVEKVDQIKEPKDLLAEMEGEGLISEEEVGGIRQSTRSKVRSETHHGGEEDRDLLEEDLSQSRTTKPFNWRT